MKARWFVTMMSAIILTASIAAGGQPPSPQASQKASAGQGPPSPKNRNLEGTWTFSTLTPLERPAEFADKPFLTDAEAAAFEKRAAERNNRDNRDASPDADVSGAYNEFWWDRGSHLALVRGKRLTSLIVDPPSGRIPALTPAAQQRVAARAAERRERPADGPEDRSLGERCLVFNAGPPMASGPYNNFVQILQMPSHLVIHNEMIHDARIVPLDGRAHVVPSIRRWQGDSRGRWEGDTLVVDTTNFTDKTNFRGADEHLHLVERFTRVDHEDAALRVHGGQSDGVHETVDGGAADDEDDGADFRIRVPRGQLRADEYSARRSIGRETLTSASDPTRARRNCEWLSARRRDRPGPATSTRARRQRAEPTG